MSATVWTYFRSLEFKDAVTLYIAAYGAILSTMAILWGIRRERRRIRVEVSPAFYAYANGELSSQMASLDVVNQGHRPTYVSAPKLRMPNKKFMTFVGADGFKDFPKRLDDGESACVRITYYEIAKSLRKAGYKGVVRLRPYCTDSTGRNHCGKRFKFDIDGGWTP